jgi:hypothetical protein
LIAKTRRLQRQALLHDKPSREDTHPKKPEARTQKPQTGTRIRHPYSFGIHRSIRPAIGTTPTVEDAASAHSLFTLSKITRARTEAPAQTFFSRSLSMPAAAARDERCCASFARWWR